jgi:hypothetical protein
MMMIAWCGIREHEKSWCGIQTHPYDSVLRMRRDFRDTRREDWKELHVLHTVSPVGRVRWRPNFPEQIATTSAVQGMVDIR